MSAIAKIYVKAIILRGSRKFKNVPKPFKADVRQLLIEAGREDLTKED